MKNSLIIVSAAIILAAMLTSCNPFAIANSGKDVNISIQVNRISAGFIDVNFVPDQDAYYLTSVDKLVKGVDPKDYEQQFMDLALDSAYVEYVNWRHGHLMKLENCVADFPSHSLNYGETNLIQNYLEPDTDYWVYCFVVDKDSNKANGKLFYKTIHTEAKSIFKTVRFAYRVKGEWDYIYPYDTEKQELVTNIPWVGATADSLDIRRLGFAAPGHYFDDVFTHHKENNGSVFTGVYAHQNNGVGDGSSVTEFKEGHTYYTAMATLDGPRNECFDIYKFTYEGPSAELTFTDVDSTQGAW